MKISEIQNKLSKNNVILKSRSYTFDTKKYNSNNPMKVNIGNIYMPGNNTMRNNINIIDVNNENNNNNKQNTFLNINKLPTIISRLSVSNFHKRIKNNKEKDLKERNNMDIINKLNVFNKTSIIGFKGIPFDSGIIGLRNNNFNNPTNFKLLNSYKEINKYKTSKEEKMNQNNANIINNINSYNNNKEHKEKKKYHMNKNSFNTKTIIHNNNKYYNNINQINNNIILFKNNNKKEKDDIREKILKKKENEEKNNICEENNDSFLNELNVLFSNVKPNNNDSQQHIKNYENNKNNDSDDDREPDPRINFEQINKVNESRPQTSYGGLNARRKNLKSAIQNVRNYNNNNRPSTSNIKP